MRKVGLLGWGGQELNHLDKYINELQSVTQNVVTGAAANTNIALTGLGANDYILGIVNLTDLADVSLAGLVVSAGNFKITADTTAKKLLVRWAKKY